MKTKIRNRKTVEKAVDPVIKVMLGYPENTPDRKVFRVLRTVSTYGRPCCKSDQCFYSIDTVENQPVIPPVRGEAIRHNVYLKKCIETGTFADGLTLDENRVHLFWKMISGFDENDYPEFIPQEIIDMACPGLMHVCPVVFSVLAMNKVFSIFDSRLT